MASVKLTFFSLLKVIMLLLDVLSPYRGLYFHFELYRECRGSEILHSAKRGSRAAAKELPLVYLFSASTGKKGISSVRLYSQKRMTSSKMRKAGDRSHDGIFARLVCDLGVCIRKSKP